ncbi:serine/threonine-protein kinase [Streptomyces griseoaurantiacus]|uniref:non-specific serine/threonine protein kinase n=1 Tax=Streptomyces griseoaurantiacus TaxID=68213 RepID=A0A1G7SWV8_9ACTN|nr:serine/threonine-protein kinase [Streptomyces jietaisiensis]SDG26770.1 Serine/threonine protein kinase [Streptomyces jietaisiensis]
MLRSLGRYELRHELGRGGMGVVWAAYDRDSGRDVAVKLLAPRARGAELTTLERRFLREARLTRRLDHPGIPAVHDHGSHEGELYLVMDLVPGRAVDAVLKSEGPLAVERAADIARGAAEVLAYAHGQNVVHRDLKPSNLMITPDDGLRVLDFGVAAALEPEPGETRFTAANATPGTVVYMAPEQAVGETLPAGDLYSLGCVLYELLTGSPPFTDGSPFMLYHQHAHSPVPPLADRRPGVPAELRTLVERLLEKRPEDRPASAAEVAAALAAWSPARARVPAQAPDPVPSAAAPFVPHPRLAEIAALRRSGSPSRALEEYEALVALPGLGRGDLLAARAGAALCASALGRTRDALDELRSVLAEQRSLLGPGDPAVLDTRYEIAVLLVRTGERLAAEELLRRLADEEERVLPPDDPRGGRSGALLARLRRMG